MSVRTTQAAAIGAKTGGRARRGACPVFARELAVMGSRFSTYVVRVVFAGTILLFMYLSGFRRFADRMDIGAMAALGRQLFEVFAWSLFVIGTALAPVVVAGAIVEEKQRRTLGLLLATDIGAFRIVTDKLCARILQLVLLLLAAVPLMATVQLFGGVSSGDVIKVFLFTFASIVQAAGVAFFFSTIFTKAYTAVIASELCIVALPAFVLMLFGQLGLMADPVVLALFFGGPLLCLMHLGASTVDYTWQYALAAGLGWATVLLLLSAFLLTRMANWSAAALLARWHKRVNRFYEAINFTHVRVPIFKRKEVGANPIAWYELHGKVPGRSLYLLRTTILLVVGLGFAYTLMSGDMFGLGFQLPMVCGQFLLVLLAVSVLASSAINSEKAQTTLELLRLTDVTFRELVLAKCLGVLKRAVPFAVLTIAHIALFVSAGFMSTQSVLIILELAVFAVFFACLGLYLSSRFRKPRSSVTVILLLLFVINTAPFVWGGLTGESWLLCFDPVFWVGTTVEGSMLGYEAGSYELPRDIVDVFQSFFGARIPSSYRPGTVRVPFDIFLPVVLGVLAVFVGVSFVLYWRLSRSSTWARGGE